MSTATGGEDGGHEQKVFREINRQKNPKHWCLLSHVFFTASRLQRVVGIITCVFCAFAVSFCFVCVSAYLMGARYEWHETKPEKRSGWCRLTVFSGSQMAWGAERSARLRLGGHEEEGVRAGV